jgi:hypothetical protein
VIPTLAAWIRRSEGKRRRNLTAIGPRFEEGAVTPSEHTRPNDRTRAAEREEARTPPHADREPTDDEEKLAERVELDPDVAEHYEEMIERGAKQKGEGRLP